MKKILLWDPRFPGRNPRHINVHDAVASAIVRTGVGAPLDPAEYSGLLSGGALDPGNLVEIALEVGFLKQMVRVVVPASVASVGIGLGIAAVTGSVQVAGSPTPTPTPTPTPATYLPTNLSAPLALALGTRKMVESYGGPAANVVRRSDSAALDIGFSGQLPDRAAAVAHQGAGSLGLAKVYDQSGNGFDGFEPVATNQMQYYVGTNDNDVCFLTSRLAGVNLSTAANPRRVRLAPMPGVNRAACTIFTMQRASAQVRGLKFLEFGDLTANQDLSLSDRNTYQALTAQWDNAGSLAEVGANDGTAKTVPGAGLSISVFKSTGSGSKLWRDSYTAVPTANTSLSSRTFANGGQWGYVHGWSPAGGAFAEHSVLLVYAGILSDAEILQVQTALQAIYGSMALVQTRGIYGVGDSTMESINAMYGRTLIRQASALMSNNIQWRNAGISGVTAATLANTAVPTTAAFPSGNGNRWQVPGAINAAIIMCGINDVTGGASAATISGYHNSLVGDALARGYNEVFLCTLMPTNTWSAGSYAANEAVRLAVNDNARAQVGSNPYTVMDFASDPVMGASTAPNNAALYPDGLHASDLGYSYLAPIAVGSLNSRGWY